MRTEVNKISVILPTYNESENIMPMIEQITDHLKDEDYEIVVVDDDSPDGTSQIVKNAMKNYPNLRILIRNGNKGLVSSIKDGLEISTGDVCLWMDADLSMPCALIKQFVKKVNAGAQFFQTNLVFEADRLDPWLEQLDKRNILDKVYILIGIAPLKSFKVAEYLHTKVPGVTLPANVLCRMEKAGEGAPEEGTQIALELIESIKNKK